MSMLKYRATLATPAAALQQVSAEMSSKVLYVKKAEQLLPLVKTTLGRC